MPRGDALRRYWAKYRIKKFLRLATEWLGERPKRLVLWEEDFDLLEKDTEFDVEFVRGGPKPVKPADRLRLHH